VGKDEWKSKKGTSTLPEFLWLWSKSSGDLGLVSYIFMFFLFFQRKFSFSGVITWLSGDFTVS